MQWQVAKTEGNRTQLKIDPKRKYVAFRQSLVGFILLNKQCTNILQMKFTNNSKEINLKHCVIQFDDCDKKNRKHL